MERAIPLLMAAGMACLAGSTAGVNDHVLELDGRFYVQGASMRTARVVVTRDEKQLRVLADDVRHLSLRLDLQQVYLLTFERDGCRSKTILFDTRVGPADLVNAPFSFQFDVTLELSSDDAVKYVGPVGYVKYESGQQDFGYDLDYRLTHDAQGQPLAASASGMEERTISNKHARNERHRVQPFIDPTLGMVLEAERHAREEGTTPCEDPVRVGIEGVTPLHMSVIPVYAAQAQVRSVVVEQEREITIVRVMERSGPSDYRRIRHTDGTTWHFHNGSSCSYSDFVAAVGAP